MDPCELWSKLLQGDYIGDSIGSILATTKGSTRILDPKPLTQSLNPRRGVIKGNMGSLDYTSFMFGCTAVCFREFRAFFMASFIRRDLKRDEVLQAL